MERQRACHWPYVEQRIGERVMLTTVHASGTETEILKEWHDELRKAINSMGHAVADRGNQYAEAHG